MLAGDIPVHHHGEAPLLIRLAGDTVAHLIDNAHGFVGNGIAALVQDPAAHGIGRVYRRRLRRKIYHLHRLFFDNIDRKASAAPGIFIIAPIADAYGVGSYSQLGGRKGPHKLRLGAYGIIKGTQVLIPRLYGEQVGQEYDPFRRIEIGADGKIRIHPLLHIQGLIRNTNRHGGAHFKFCINRGIGPDILIKVKGLAACRVGVPACKFPAVLFRIRSRLRCLVAVLHGLREKYLFPIHETHRAGGRLKPNLNESIFGRHGKARAFRDVLFAAILRLPCDFIKHISFIRNSCYFDITTRLGRQGRHGSSSVGAHIKLHWAFHSLIDDNIYVDRIEVHIGKTMVWDDNQLFVRQLQRSFLYFIPALTQ